MKAAVILGAGFSKNSGVPVLSEIPKLLITSQGNTPFENDISKVLTGFLEDVFGIQDKETLPNLDDILTCIDICIRSGHHMGLRYAPAHLIAIRKFLMYRLFNILQQSFRVCEDIKTLLKLFHGRFSSVGYVSLNWDAVLERYLLSLFENVALEYANGGKAWRETAYGHPLREIKILKVHGSANWIFCNNCRTLFYDLYDDVANIKKAGFRREDLELFEEMKGITEDWQGEGEHCTLCGNSISSHIATCSYRKSFRSSAFPEIWAQAEKVLTEADQWIFIGYSLPDADYEFKHLLKIAEMKLRHRKEKRTRIDIVLLNDNASANEYRKFFGQHIHWICNKGIQDYISYVSSL